MHISDLNPNPRARPDKRRVGRGHGSGRVKTAGKGTKGQKARTGGSIRPQFEGGQLPIVKRLPYKRGFVNIFAIDWEIANLDDLDRFPAGTEITREVLYGARIIEHVKRPLKILGTGSLATALTVKVHAVSAGAREAIEAAGGSIEIIPGKPKPEQTKRGKKVAEAAE